MGNPNGRPGWRVTPETFWLSVDRTGDCWLWTGRISRDGYGRIGFHGRPHARAHRVAYELYVGAVENGQVLHRCDVRACVRPEHLYLGTHAENMRDRESKGRGCKTSNATLTEVDVRAIRAIRGMTQPAIARAFGVSKITVNRIVNRRSWAHIGVSS